MTKHSDLRLNLSQKGGSLPTKDEGDFVKRSVGSVADDIDRTEEVVSRSASPDSSADGQGPIPTSHSPTDDDSWFNILPSLPACYVLFGLLLPLMVLHWWLSRSKRRGVTVGSSQRGKTQPKALVIVAHPDDECMFFSPTIQGLKAQGFKTLLLCLSRGDYYSLGQVREKELYKSCAVLGIGQGCCSIVNHSSFPDDPNKEWDTSLLSQIIHSYITSTQADVVITFDEKGVSGHSNHKAIYGAINKLIYPVDKKAYLPNNVSVYVLESTNILRKYTGVLDVILSWWWGKILYVAGYSAIMRGWRAMWAHWSQLKWFRVLYIGFSRYMFMNTLRKIRQGAF